MQNPLQKKQSRIPWRWVTGFLVIYVLTVMPVGLFIYQLKSEHGYDMFRRGGFHTYLKCVSKALEIKEPSVIK